MNTERDKNTARFLGAAFVFVFAASLLTGVLHASAVGSELFVGGDGISSVMLSIADNAALMRISILVELVNCVGIVVLASLLYVSLRKVNESLALVALGWWMVEAIVLVVSKLGGFALIPLSQEFVEAGAPSASAFQSLGSVLYYGVDRTGYDLHMLFFCLGALIWYALLFQGKLVPRFLSGWGLAAVFLVTIASVVKLADPSIELPIALYVPYIPFELFIGLWLIIRGFEPVQAEAVSAEMTLKQA
ncbi:MAG: DUF4386 domain-containing protein [Chloroflexi bacterium]|nr:DUF4386 domain-containing protein [Chloroflexota bacterium]